MEQHQGLVNGGWDRAMRNKRYIFWFYVLNLGLAWFGAAGFNNQAHDFLDHSLLADRLLHGFDLAVLIEMLFKPEFGSIHGVTGPSLHFALLFFALTALFLPGVLQGYASTYRLPREEFFRACGRNLWRFIRLMIVAGIVFLVLGGALFGIRFLLLKQAEENTNELLPFYVSMASLTLMFLVMATLRIWFDLTQADVVLSDQRAVRRSIGKAFRHTWHSLADLLGAYVLTTLVALIVLAAGLWFWLRFVPPAGVFRAFLVSQLLLLLLLIPRFWQRGVAVTYYMQNMVEPVAVVQSNSAPLAGSAVVLAPTSIPVIPSTPPDTPES